MYSFTSTFNNFSQDQIHLLQDEFQQIPEEIRFSLLKSSIQNYKLIKSSQIHHNQEDIQKIISQNINEINTKNEQIIKDYQNQIQNNSFKLQLLQQKYDIETKFAHDNYNNILSEKKKIEIMYSEEKNKNDKLLAEINNINTSFCNKFDTLHNKMFSSASKGSIGENIVENFINTHFSLFQLINTSALHSRGDFFLTNNTLKLLIENKNMSNIRSDDIDKFYRDVKINVDSGSINAALFISLNDTYLINNKKGFVFEIKYGIPIVFIGNVYENIYIINYAIKILLYLVENGITINNIDHNDAFFLDITSLLTTLHDFYNEITQNDVKEKKAAEAVIECIKNRSLSMDFFIKHFSNFTSKYPSYFNKSTSNNHTYIQKILSTLPKSNFYTKDITYKRLEEYGFDKDTIKSVGGIDAVKEAYKQINPDWNSYTAYKKNELSNQPSTTNDQPKPIFDLSTSIYPRKI